MTSKKVAVGHIWDSHWSSNAVEIKPLKDPFAQKWYQKMKRFVSEQDQMILEAGCGTGRVCALLARDFPKVNIVGIDLSLNSLKIAEHLKEEIKQANLRFEYGDLFHIPYPDDYFDIVFNEGVIQHFSLDESPTYKDAVQEMVRVVKPGGKVIISVINWYCFPHTIYKWAVERVGPGYEYGYEKSYTHKELRSLFKEFGLHTLEITGYYPAHGFFRLGKYSRAFTLLGRVVNSIQNEAFERQFGFEIVIKGTKPLPTRAL